MRDAAPKPEPRLARTAVLIGMMGAGKTAIGREIAARLGAELRDSDAEIVSRAGLDVAEIFDRYGEAFFRERETRVIARLLEGPPCVLATGGGAWLKEETRTLLNRLATVVWLRVDLPLLWQRVGHKTTRPLLRVADPRAALTRIYEDRAPIYALAPHAVHVQPAWSIGDTADRVLRVLRDAGGIEGPGTA